jgi:hypothetical protein
VTATARAGAGRNRLLACGFLSCMRMVRTASQQCVQHDGSARQQAEDAGAHGRLESLDRSALLLQTGFDGQGRRGNDLRSEGKYRPEVVFLRGLPCRLLGCRARGRKTPDNSREIPSRALPLRTPGVATAPAVGFDIIPCTPARALGSPAPGCPRPATCAASGSERGSAVSPALQLGGARLFCGADPASAWPSAVAMARGLQLRLSVIA